MHEIRLGRWEDCEAEILRIEEESKNSLVGVCFRGHANSNWSLQTTLERRTTANLTFIEYYNLMLRVKPAIETLQIPLGRCRKLPK